MVDLTKIVQKSFGDEEDDRKKKEKKKKQVEVKDDNSPLNDLFGKPEEKSSEDHSSEFSRKLGNLFGVEEE